MKQVVVDGLFTMVDDADYDNVNQYIWHIKWKEKNHPYVYRYVKRIGKPGYAKEKLHNFILGRVKGKTVDHKDRNVLNNQRYNLRHATQTQQAQNTSKTSSSRSTSKFKGVSKQGLIHHKYSSNKPWRARIRVDGKLIGLGYYKTEEEAALAYNKAAKKYFGEFACLNILGAECVK